MSSGTPARGRPLRVLHGTHEIAGQGMVLALGLRALGCDARSLAYRVDWDGRRPDLVLELDRMPHALARGAAMLGALARWGPRHDVFHFHFGTSFLHFGTSFLAGRLRQLDLGVLRAMGKKVFFHFHGCEVRRRRHMLAAHRLATCTECDPFCSPPRQDWLLRQAERYADGVFYSTLDLGESIPGGMHLPLAIETARWEEAGRHSPLPDPSRRDGVNGPVVVAHAPTNRLIKGTRHVLAAVEELQREFPRLELRLIEKRPWAEVPGLLAGCDLLVDQLFMGWYGLLAIEGMAEGKPVVSYIREDFRALQPDLPVVSAEPGTLREVLHDLIRDPARRRELGARGPAYVRREHDAEAVAARLLARYREALAG